MWCFTGKGPVATISKYDAFRSTILQILHQIDDLPAGAKLALFGAGSTGREFLLNLRKRRPDVDVACFIDTYLKGECEGIDILPPSAARTVDARLIVTSAFWPEIVDKVDDAWILSNELINQSSHLNSFGPFYFDRADAPELERRLARLKPHFRTEADFAILKNVFDLRVHRREREFFSFAQEHLRRQKSKFAEIDKYSQNVDIGSIRYAIEGGVFDGQDTLQLLNKLSRSPKFQKLYAFDPFQKPLNDGPYISKIDAVKCEFIEAALWDKDEPLSFNIDRESPSNSRIADDGYKIKGVKLDTFAKVANIPVDLIKLDVEGAEMNVLLGAEKTIERDKPQCAISTYHRREHLLDIPEFLLSLNPNYVLSMYAYNASFIDIVLHAN